MEPRLIVTGEGTIHFVSVTDEGLVIISENDGDKSVIQDLRTMRNLNGAIMDWLREHTCPEFMVDPTQPGGIRIACEILRGHAEELHFGRRWNTTTGETVGVVYWSDDKHAVEFHKSA